MTSLLFATGLTLLAAGALAEHPNGTTIERIFLWQVSSLPSQSGGLSVQLGNPEGIQPTDVLRLTVTNLRGDQLFQQSKQPTEEYTHFDLPASLPEGGHRANVELTDGTTVYDEGNRVHSVVAHLAEDVRYGFYANFGAVGGDYLRKADLLTDCHINAVEYYDWFPAHGDYTPDTLVYQQAPFGQTIYRDDLTRKMTESRGKRIANIAYIAAYAGVPSIVNEVEKANLLDAMGNRIAFHGGEVGPESNLAGVWFYLTAFAEGTAWRAHLWTELTRILEPSATVPFDGIELDTYGWLEPYYDGYGAHNGTPMMEMLADLTADVRALVRANRPNGLTTLNNVAEAGIERFIGREDFLFVENWAFHKPRYDDTLAMIMGRGSANAMRFVSKCYPSDMTPPKLTWPAQNLRNLMATHIAGGGSFMVAGEPRDATEQIGGLNSPYYPDNQVQSAENFAIVRAYNALDAALYTRNHGPGVRPLATELSIDGVKATAFQATGGATTWCLLRLAGAERWDESNAAVEPAPAQQVTLTLPNGIVPAKVLYANPDSDEYAYPMPIPFAESGGRVTVELPPLGTLGVIVVEPADMATRLWDLASDPSYDEGWASGAGGAGWSGGWSFSGASSTSNHMLGRSTGNGGREEGPDADIDTVRRSFGLFSGTGNVMDAQRSFLPMMAGESLRVEMDNGWIENGGAVGIGIRNASGQDLLEVFFRGGATSYTVRDGDGEHDTAIPFTDQGLDLEFTRMDADQYRLRIVPIGTESRTFQMTGTLLSGTGGGDPTTLRLFSFSAGSGASNDAYFNSIRMYNRPASAVPAAAWVVR